MNNDYLVIQVRVSQVDLVKHVAMGLTRDAREAHLKDYLEQLGLRPRHDCGTIEWWDDPVTYCRLYRQRVPRTGEVSHA